MMGCGMLVVMLHSAAPQTLIPLEMRSMLIAKPSGTLCTANVVVTSIPSGVAACAVRQRTCAVGRPTPHWS